MVTRRVVTHPTTICHLNGSKLCRTERSLPIRAFRKSEPQWMRGGTWTLSIPGESKEGGRIDSRGVAVATHRASRWSLPDGSAPHNEGNVSVQRGGTLSGARSLLLWAIFVRPL